MPASEATLEQRALIHKAVSGMEAEVWKAAQVIDNELLALRESVKTLQAERDAAVAKVAEYESGEIPFDIETGMPIMSVEWKPDNRSEAQQRAEGFGLNGDGTTPGFFKAPSPVEPDYTALAVKQIAEWKSEGFNAWCEVTRSPAIVSTNGFPSVCIPLDSPEAVPVVAQRLRERADAK